MRLSIDTRGSLITAQLTFSVTKVLSTNKKNLLFKPSKVLDLGLGISQADKEYSNHFISVLVRAATTARPRSLCGEMSHSKVAR